MKCPRCLNPLSEVVLHGQSVDQCSACGGSWFDPSELGNAVEAMTVADNVLPLPSADEATVCCPECRTQMLQLNYAYDSGVMIDRCPNCYGVWLDADELTHIGRHHKGTPAVNRLCAALSAEIQRENRWKRLRQATRSRWASGCVAAVYLICAIWRTRSLEAPLEMVPGLFLLLMFIWYPDDYGRYTTKGIWNRFLAGGDAITQESPGDAVAVAGWLVLLSPLLGWLLAWLMQT